MGCASFGVAIWVLVDKPSFFDIIDKAEGICNGTVIDDSCEGISTGLEIFGSATYIILTGTVKLKNADGLASEFWVHKSSSKIEKTVISWKRSLTTKFTSLIIFHCLYKKCCGTPLSADHGFSNLT